MDAQTGDGRAVRGLFRKHYPAIDSLRGLAALMVFICHYGGQIPGDKIFFWGWTGVDIFFVLSGFLITGILFDSLGEEGYFRKFYMRRTLRIFPLYYTFWAMMLVLTPVLLISWNKYVALDALYVGNFYTSPLSSLLAFRRTHIHINMLVLGHFWSLAVEEQFYIVWPLVVFLAKDRMRLMRICGWGVLFVVGLRTALFFLRPDIAHNTYLMYGSTYCRCDSLLLGGWAALWLRGTDMTIATMRRRLKMVGAAVVAALIASEAVCLIHYPYYRYVVSERMPWLETYGYTLIDLLALCLLLTCLRTESWLYRMLRASKLEKLGRVSYGFYIIHDLPYNAFYSYQDKLASHHLQLVAPVVWFFLSYGLAQLSYRYIESPFLRLKKKYATKADPQPYPPPASIS